MSSTKPNNIPEKVDLQFKHISYSVKQNFFSKTKYQILNKISGSFKSSELTAIVGPSGCGKTTLLNILTGYVSLGKSGEIYENNVLTTQEVLSKKCCYIMQNETMHATLTTKEAVTFSANLRLSKDISLEEKKRRIKDILNVLGIYHCRKTLIGRLSGGEKKRVSIALELVQNPQVMFFDEPTSGLDISASTQVLLTLHKLAHEGRTIICTIHQPSATLLEMFDYLYGIADGYCIYQGSVSRLLPYLESCDPSLVCPKYHNPADFLIEICRKEYRDILEKLVKNCNNGFNFECSGVSEINKINSADESCHKISDNVIQTSTKNIPNCKEISILKQSENFGQENNKETSSEVKNCQIKVNKTTAIKKNVSKEDIYATSFSYQLWLLLKRAFILSKRNPKLIYIRLSLNIFISIVMGSAFFGMGADARHATNNLNFIFFVLLFNMYVSFTSMIVAFADDLPIVTREHFNRWYSIKSYYIAITLLDLPIQLLSSFIFITISFSLTSQTNEWFRFFMFLFLCYLVALVAQSFGMLFSAAMSLQNALMLGTLVISGFIAFSGFCIPMKHAFVFLHWIFDISFIRYGFEGITHVIYGYDRKNLNCSTNYCHFQDPKKFLEEVGMEESRVMVDVCALLIFYIVVKSMTYIVLWVRIAKMR